MNRLHKSKFASESIVSANSPHLLRNPISIHQAIQFQALSPFRQQRIHTDEIPLSGTKRYIIIRASDPQYLFHYLLCEIPPARKFVL
ncbi:hypothetical protein CDAR_183251 [Caerostris darwini]|uniref:Uncharacterized protein n=1 Tax=Caerostris darwini TaxID=1538125 RepID=A0AAV4TAD2_9ARAC|nr:hypothetical protein CDAR_183251 [Caerostris darwini]